MFDYEVLRIVWWLLLGVLLIGFAVFDGFDLGVAILLPFVAKNDEERRVAINTVGPVWEGNQVWFILGGGAIFAAWPYVYAVAFSGFYFAMFVVLSALILRPVGFKYRSKLESTCWRAFWDWGLFVGGLVPALVFGVAIGNVLQGVPFHFDDNLRAFYTGSFWALFNPFALLCGLTSVAMLTMHGGAYLVTKTDNSVQQRARRFAVIAAVMTIIFFVLGGLWVQHGVMGYHFTSAVTMDGPSNPLLKTVGAQSGGWTQHFAENQLLWLVPTAGFFAMVLFTMVVQAKEKLAFFLSTVAVASIIATVGVTMFPFILPSSSNPSMSLTVWDASSSLLTLAIMLMVTVVMMPIILMYTRWVYGVLRGKVTKQYLRENSDMMY